MKNLLFILFVIFGTQLFAQDYKIEYSHNITFDANKTEAIYNFLQKKAVGVYFKVNSEFIDFNGNDAIPINGNVTPFLVKNYETKKIRYNQPIMSSIKFLEESLPLQNWQLVDESKKIKDLNCSKATTIFRGREYTAWYTSDLGIVGGPWKFDGLPGLILEVSSDDGVVDIKALSIEKKSDINMPSFEYKVEDVITWEEYVKNYQKFLKRMRKSLKAESDEEFDLSMNINLVELFEGI